MYVYFITILKKIFLKILKKELEGDFLAMLKNTVGHTAHWYAVG